MPYVLKDEQLPENMIKWDKLVNKTFILLNIAVPLFECITVGMIWQVELTQRVDSAWVWQVFNAIDQISIGILEIISGVYLLIALSKIKAFLKETGNESMLNTAMMLTHLATFGLYLASEVTQNVIQDLFFFLFSAS